MTFLFRMERLAVISTSSRFCGWRYQENIPAKLQKTLLCMMRASSMPPNSMNWAMYHAGFPGHMLVYYQKYYTYKIKYTLYKVYYRSKLININICMQEKTVFLRYMNILSFICMLITAFEIFHVCFKRCKRYILVL